MRRRYVAVPIVLAALVALPRFVPGPPPGDRWWKGNTHTHSLASDGDHYPEMVALWYREHGYDFLVMTEHNPPLVPEERWVAVDSTATSQRAYEAYLARFGADWVDQHRRGGTLYVRLKRLEEFRDRVRGDGHFLLLSGQEITQYLGGRAAHMNALNLAEPLAPREGATLREIFARDIAAVDSARAAGAAPIGLQLNHPNWLHSVTVEDLAALDGVRLFERYNAHPASLNDGDSVQIPAGRLWDLALTDRLRRGGAPLYGVATDDAHHYHDWGPERSNPGRAWVMVRSPTLTPRAIVEALERGDFYASTGVQLEEVRHERGRLTLRIRPERGVTYHTRFLGARGAGEPTVLAEADGVAAGYALAGDELYVRAEVVSSKPHPTPSVPDEHEAAWVQPVVPEVARQTRAGAR